MKWMTRYLMKIIKTLYQIIHNILVIFNKNYHIINMYYERPAFVRYINEGYYSDKNDFDRLIINLKKEVSSMDARNLVIEQLENLKKEKDDLIAKVVDAEKEKIEAVKLKAAEEAENLYRKEIEDRVSSQFKIAEEHLNELLASLPEETKEDDSLEIEEQSNEEQNPLI